MLALGITAHISEMQLPLGFNSNTGRLHKSLGQEVKDTASNCHQALLTESSPSWAVSYHTKTSLLGLWLTSELRFPSPPPAACYPPQTTGAQSLYTTSCRSAPGPAATPNPSPGRPADTLHGSVTTATAGMQIKKKRGEEKQKEAARNLISAPAGRRRGKACVESWAQCQPGPSPPSPPPG